MRTFRNINNPAIEIVSMDDSDLNLPEKIRHFYVEVTVEEKLKVKPNEPETKTQEPKISSPMVNVAKFNNINIENLNEFIVRSTEEVKEFANRGNEAISMLKGYCDKFEMAISYLQEKIKKRNDRISYIKGRYNPFFDKSNIVYDPLSHNCIKEYDSWKGGDSKLIYELRREVDCYRCKHFSCNRVCGDYYRDIYKCKHLSEGSKINAMVLEFYRKELDKLIDIVVSLINEYLPLWKEYGKLNEEYNKLVIGYESYHRGGRRNYNSEEVLNQLAPRKKSFMDELEEMNRKAREKEMEDRAAKAW